MTTPMSRPEDLEQGQSYDWAAATRLFEAMGRELRRPLEGALALTQLLERQPLTPDARAYVDTLAEHHRNLLAMLAEASDLARAERGSLTLDVAACELRPLMDGIQEAWEARALQSGLALSVSYDGADLLVAADGPRLRQLFDNLIERALRLTPRGGVEASLSARRSGSRILLEGRVRDGGADLASERLARIFDPSAATDPDGVGMVLCRHLVDAMQGSVWARGNTGAGATVAFELQVDEMNAAGNESQPSAARAAHVLVVDDNATNRMVAEALCEMFDCTSETAEDGLEAVEAARTGRFDLILMDIKMPNMDGVEATRAIRALGGPNAAVPIIALTANADPEDAAGYIASGMSSVVEKPIKPDALLTAMNACLQGGTEADDHAAAA